jgi:molybdopterin-guanine dinucleotide biosynthesis protein A
VITALATSGQNVLTAACDLPWLDTASVALVLHEAHTSDGVQAVHGGVSGHLVPVIWWSASSLLTLEAAFEGGLRSLHGALSLLRTSMVEFEAETAQGANSPSDL